MAFLPKSTMLPFGAPILRRDVIANSVVMVVGDSVKVSSGFIALGTAGAAVYGHVMGIGTNKGVGLNSTGVAGSVVGSFINSFTCASDNQTNAQVRAESDVSKATIWSAKSDNTLGVTTGSNLLGFYVNLQDETQTHEASATATSGTTQYFILGVDPLDATKQLVTGYTMMMDA